MVRMEPGAFASSYEGLDFTWSDGGCQPVLEVSANRGSLSEIIQYVYLKDDTAGSVVSGIVVPTEFAHIQFAVEMESEEQALAYFDDLLEWGVREFARLTEIYKGVAQEFDFRTPRVSDCRYASMFVADEYVFNGTDIVAQMRPLRHKRRHPTAHASGHVKIGLSSSDVDRIRHAMKAGQAVQLHDSLLLDARVHMVRDEAFDLSVILSNVAFEVFIQTAIRQLARQQNQDTITVGKGAHAKQMAVDDAIAKGRIREDLFTYWQSLAKRKVRGTKVYEDWYNDAYTLRNEIVHSGLRDVSKKQAAGAFDAIIRLINVMNSRDEHGAGRPAHGA